MANFSRLGANLIPDHFSRFDPKVPHFSRKYPPVWGGRARRSGAARENAPRGPGRAGPAMAYGGYGLCEKQGLYGRPAALFRRFPGHWPNFGAEALAVAEAAPLAELR